MPLLPVPPIAAAAPAAAAPHRPARPRWTPFLAALAVGWMAAAVAASPALTRGFEGPDTAWRLLPDGGAARILDQQCVYDEFRAGAASERLVLAAPAGRSAHLACATDRLPVLDELRVRLWVKANRPGVRLAVRVVLPRSPDPTAQVPQTAILHGAAYERTGQWQQLTLSEVPHLLADHVRVMRAVPGTRADSHEAFVDAIVLLVPGGPGQTVVWTDDLEADGIVLEGPSDAMGPTLRAADTSGPDDDASRSVGWRQELAPSAGQGMSDVTVQLQGTTLLVDGKPFVPRAIPWNGEPLQFLAERGFNAVLLPQPPTDKQAAEARQYDLWLICAPPRPDVLAQQGLADTSGRVLAWYFGDPVADGEPDLEYVPRWVELVREHDPLPNRPIIMAPEADWQAVSMLADVLVAGHPRASTLAAADFADWLAGRPRLARPGTPFWVQIPTQPGRLVHQQVQALTSRTQLPSSVDGAQVESLVRIACTRGCRGFLFQSHSPLSAEDNLTRLRAATLELVNRQLVLIEPWLASGKAVGRVTTADSAETAVVLQVEQARLLIPLDWLAGQGARGGTIDAVAPAPKSLVVPGVPESNHVFLLSPAGLRPLTHRRVAGGILVVFGQDDDAMALLTEDPRVIAAFRQRTIRLGQPVARLGRDLAVAQTKQVVATGRRLEQLGLDDVDARRDVAAADAMVKACDRQLASGDVERAYQSAGAARRLLSLAAARQKRGLDPSGLLVSSPLAVSYETLAEDAALGRSSAALDTGENQLYGGDFEDAGQLIEFGWQHVSHLVPGITAAAELSAEGPQSGRYCLTMSAGVTLPGQAPALVPAAPVRITSPPVPVTAGQFVEISGWVRVPEPIVGSIDGLQIVDSLGGPELALDVDEAPDWQPFRMIRAVPAAEKVSGTFSTSAYAVAAREAARQEKVPDTFSSATAVTVTFALTGLGTASVDAVMIRPLSRPAVRRLPPVEGAAEPRGPNTAGRPQPLFAAPQPR